MDNLHLALEVPSKTIKSQDNIEFGLVGLRQTKDQLRWTIHINPQVVAGSGVDIADFLALLGFQRCRCPFLSSRECYARFVSDGTDLDNFAFSFAQAAGCFRAAGLALDQCGIFLGHVDGPGVLGGYGASSDAAGDGHTALKREGLKQSEDERFHYVLSFLETNRTRGWVVHRKPKPPPLSVEEQASFVFLGIRNFDGCPEFEFQRCCWSYTPLRTGQAPKSFWNSNADAVDKAFEAHPKHFSRALGQLLQAESHLKPLGLTFLPASNPPRFDASSGAGQVGSEPAEGAVRGTPSKTEAGKGSFSQILARLEKIVSESINARPNITIHGSVNVLNTGQIQSMTSIKQTVSSLPSEKAQLAEALGSVTEAVVSNPDLNDEQRGEFLDQLDELGKQALLPDEKRSKAGVLKGLVNGLGSGLQAAKGLADTWNQWGPTIQGFFDGGQ